MPRNKRFLELVKVVKDNTTSMGAFGLIELEINEIEKDYTKLENFYNYFSEMYGKGHEVSNWHLNGKLEPFDNFFDSAEE